jgi:putative MATE family efflux protein
MNRDLTVGKPGKVLVEFCLPLFGSIVFQQLYNIADSFVAGKFISEDALAAVGNSYEITLIFIAFAFGCNIGCSVVTSRLFGAKDYTSMKSAVSTSLISTALTCFVLMTVGLVSMNGLLSLINTPENIYADSALYLSIYIWGLPFLFLYNVSTGIFSALGDSRTPFVFLAASSTSNIFMDILFVTAFNMGVAGVAWATFICQGVSAVLALVFVLRRLGGIKTEKKPELFNKTLFKSFVTIAIPSTLQQSFVSVGNIILQGIINSFGSSVIAGYSAAIKLNNLVITSFTTIANGVSNYTAQNLGAEKPGRVKEGCRSGVRMVWVISVPFILLWILLSDSLLGLFVDNPSAVTLQTGRQLLRIVSPFYLVVCVKIICDGVLKGAGKMTPFMISTFSDLILRVALAAVLSRTALGVTGIWLSWPIGWSVGTAISIAFYKKESKSFIDRKEMKEEVEIVRD